MAITIGKAHLKLGSRFTTSIVQLYYLNSKLQVVNLWSGDHPYINLKQSGLSFTIKYKSGETDLAQVINEHVSKKIECMLESLNIRMSKGKMLEDNIGWYHLKPPENLDVSGLYFPPAVAYKSWFR